MYARSLARSLWKRMIEFSTDFSPEKSIVGKRAGGGGGGERYAPRGARGTKKGSAIYLDKFAQPDQALLSREGGRGRGGR